jgi:hypothetical protein
METPQHIEECSPVGGSEQDELLGPYIPATADVLSVQRVPIYRPWREFNALTKGERLMNTIEIVYDAKQGRIIMKVQPGLLPKEHDGTIGLNYDEAVQLFSTLGELIEKYEDNEDQLGSSEHSKAV